MRGVLFWRTELRTLNQAIFGDYEDASGAGGDYYAQCTRFAAALVRMLVSFVIACASSATTSADRFAANPLCSNRRHLPAVRDHQRDETGSADFVFVPLISSTAIVFRPQPVSQHTACRRI